ncbi:hypothetical protein [Sporocytophaga sp.]|uniref:hypothetical protein n=1 Tax=Sporocytophaga sp. TaxID=2231183 RepID=UPI00345C3BB8
MKSDSTVVAWGRNTENQCNVPTGLSKVIAISAGAYHSVALTSDGTVISWGSNNNGQQNVPVGLDSVIAIFCADYATFVLKSNGRLEAWVGWEKNTGGQLMWNMFRRKHRYFSM